MARVTRNKVRMELSYETAEGYTAAQRRFWFWQEWQKYSKRRKRRW